MMNIVRVHIGSWTSFCLLKMFHLSSKASSVQCVWCCVKKQINNACWRNDVCYCWALLVLGFSHCYISNLMRVAAVENTCHIIKAVVKTKLARSANIWGNVGRRLVSEVGEVEVEVEEEGGGHEAKAAKTSTMSTTPVQRGPPLSALLLSSPSQDLFSRAPLPHRMFGVGHWMPASCVLGGAWQRSEGQTPCRNAGRRGRWGEGGVWALHKHITRSRETRSIVQSETCAISAV